MKRTNTFKRALAFAPLLLLAAVPAIAQPLNGTYTIGGTSPNYTSFLAAANDITAKGIAGPVVFNIRPGTYTTDAYGSLDNITGTSATNTITIKPEAGRGTVTLNPTGTTANNYVIQINNTDHVMIQDLTLNNASSSRGRDISLLGTSSFNTVTRCLLTGNAATSTSRNKARIYAESLSGTDNSFTNDSILTGSYAMYSTGDGSSPAMNGTFSNNTVINPGGGVVYLTNSDNYQIEDNTTTLDAASTTTGSFYGFYNEYVNGTNIKGNSIVGSGLGTDSFYPLYMYECNTNGSSTRMNVRENTFDINTTGYYIGMLVNYCAEYSINKNTLTFTDAYSIPGFDVYNDASAPYGENTTIDSNVITLTNSYGEMNIYTSNGGGYNHSFSGNTLNATGAAYAYFYGQGQGVRKSKISNNVINLTSYYDGYMYMSDYGGGDSLIVDNNITSQIVSNGYASTYLYQGIREVKITNNTMSIKAGSGAGAYFNSYSNSSSANDKTNNIISGNKIYSEASGNYGYSDVSFDQGNGDKIFNNVFVATSNSANSQATACGIGGAYGNVDIYNNTVVLKGSTTNQYNYGLRLDNYNYNNTTYNVFNNIIYKSSSGGYPLSVYEQTMGQKVITDYNNIYSASGGYIWNAWNYTAGPSTLTAWRASSGRDKNSLSYAPAFTNPSSNDFTPDATSPNCWSMNGRGVHYQGNGTDIEGNTRALSPGLGVPDLGAYEFVPGSGVIPPLCTVLPASSVPTAGVTQIYTFGEDTVASITWDAAATTLPAAAPDCRQYSGVQPPGLSAINPTSMFFYTDINSGTSADYDANIYYKEPWIGTIGTEAALHLAKKDGSNPWIGYAFGTSGADITRNFIYGPTSPKLNTYGLYTGIDVANNAGTAEIVTPSGHFCPGTYPVSVRIKNNGNNVLNSVKIYWEINGVAGSGSPITYTTPIPVNSGPANSNAAIINLGNVAFGAAANNFKIWTSDPNGVLDIVTADDTIRKTLRASLSGVYTVGGTTPDFPNVEQAVNDLNDLGICGPVTFNIRPGTYTSTKALTIYAVTGGGNASNRVTFQSENNSAASVVVTYAGTLWDNGHTLKLSNASYITIKNITLNNTGTVPTALGLDGNSNNDSLVGCILNANIAATYNSYGIRGDLYNGSGNDNLVFQNNDVTAFYCLQMQGNYNAFCRNTVIENNIFRTGYQNGMSDMYKLKFNYNTILGITTSVYAGLQISNYDQGPANNNFEMIGNKVNTTSGYYGMYIYQPNGAYPNNPPDQRSIFANNVITYGGTSGNYALYMNGPSRVDIINNSINAYNTSSSVYAAYIQTYGYPYEDNAVKNNVFANMGGGMSYYLGMYDGISDYNNVYSTAGAAANKYGGFYGTFTNLTNFRNALASNGWEQNSIAYNPGFTSNTDLTPDPTNAASWSLNGRAEQQSVMPKDWNGNARPETLADGVPDIGAYEFEPTALPPAAVATPAAASPGTTQVFTFGEQKVATVKWNTAMAITTPLTVRQYSGRVPVAGYTSIAPTHQYFYTTMTPSAAGVTYDFDLKINYLDIWMGTMPSEPDMKMAHQRGVSPWISYNEANSETDDASNEIKADGVTSFGSFTGIEDGINFSALISRDRQPVICTGDTVMLHASPVSGGSTTYTYLWTRNGVVIPGATSADFPATLGGDYAVTVTGTQSATSLSESIIVMAPPMALVGASGPLTYCTGGALTLMSTSPANVITYQWQMNNADVPGAVDTTFDVSTAGTYRLIVTNAGCSDTSAPVIVNAGPIAVNLGTDFSACEIKNQPFILDAGYPGAKYTWNTGDTTQTIEVYKSGTYSVQVDAGTNCKGTDDITVTVKPLPTASGINTVRTNNSYIFSPAGAQNITKLLWIFSDGTTSTSNTVVKNFDGNMTVKLVLYNECGSDTIQMLQWGTGIANTENKSIEASLYPNPATEKTLLSVSGAKIEDVIVMNAVGQVVYQASLDVKAATIELPVGNLAAGRYIVRATTTEGIISKPLNVQR